MIPIFLIWCCIYFASSGVKFSKCALQETLSSFYDSPIWTDIDKVDWSSKEDSKRYITELLSDSKRIYNFFRNRGHYILCKRYSSNSPPLIKTLTDYSERLHNSWCQALSAFETADAPMIDSIFDNLYTAKKAKLLVKMLIMILRHPEIQNNHTLPRLDPMIWLVVDYDDLIASSDGTQCHSRTLRVLLDKSIAKKKVIEDILERFKAHSPNQLTEYATMLTQDVKLAIIQFIIVNRILEDESIVRQGGLAIRCLFDQLLEYCEGRLHTFMCLQHLVQFAKPKPNYAILDYRLLWESFIDAISTYNAPISIIMKQIQFKLQVSPWCLRNFPEKTSRGTSKASRPFREEKTIMTLFEAIDARFAVIIGKYMKLMPFNIGYIE